MKRDVMSRLDKIEEWVGVVETRSPQVVEDYRAGSTTRCARC